MPSVKMSKVRAMHEKLCERYHVAVELKFVDGFFAWGEFKPFCNPWTIIIKKDGNYMKAGTLCHEWAHAIEWLERGTTNHFAMPFRKIQKTLMVEFGVKFNEERWSDVVI